MLVDEAQAFAFARREKLNRVGRRVLGFSHNVNSKRRLEAFVYFAARTPDEGAFRTGHRPANGEGRLDRPLSRCG